MKVNTVSSHNDFSKKSLSLSKSNKNINFQGAKLTSSEQAVKEIWCDGPDLLKIVKETMPVLKEKFNQYFDAIMEILPDMDRTVTINVQPNAENYAKLRQHIIDNNANIFKFPPSVIEDMKTPGGGYWMKCDYYNPFKTSFDDNGFSKTKESIIKFAQTKDENKFIKELFALKRPDLKDSNNSVPSYYWEFPGG